MNWKQLSMHNVIKTYTTEINLLLVLVVLCTYLSLATDNFFTLVNLTDLMENSAVNLIWAVGLLVVLIAGGIDISFAVAASVVQYVAFFIFVAIGGGNWLIGFVVAAGLGLTLGFINAALIHYFRIISIVVTIATFNVFFGLLMFISNGKYLYNLPDWWATRSILLETETSPGAWAELTLPIEIGRAHV